MTNIKRRYIKKIQKSRVLSAKKHHSTPKRGCHYHDDGTFAYDTLTLDTETVDGQPLLQQVMKSGKRLKSATSLKEIRQNVEKQIKNLHPALLSLNKTERYSVKISKDLHQLTKNIRKS